MGNNEHNDFTYIRMIITRTPMITTVTIVITIMMRITITITITAIVALL